MVFFTCSGCGESLKKNKVENHICTCRSCEYLTCIDCGADFYGDGFKSHVQCMTENEKYSAKGTEFKPNKGDVKQQQWIQKIESVMKSGANLSQKAKDLISNLGSYDNIPRKRAKFLNFLKNSLRIYDAKLGEEVWDAFSAADKKPSSEETISKAVEEKEKIAVNFEITKSEDAAASNGDSRKGGKKKKSKKGVVEVETLSDLTAQSLKSASDSKAAKKQKRKNKEISGGNDHECDLQKAKITEKKVTDVETNSGDAVQHEKATKKAKNKKRRKKEISTIPEDVQTENNDKKIEKEKAATQSQSSEIAQTLVANEKGSGALKTNDTTRAGSEGDSKKAKKRRKYDKNVSEIETNSGVQNGKCVPDCKSAKRENEKNSVTVEGNDGIDGESDFKNAKNKKKCKKNTCGIEVVQNGQATSDSTDLIKDNAATVETDTNRSSVKKVKKKKKAAKNEVHTGVTVENESLANAIETVPGSEISIAEVENAVCSRLTPGGEKARKKKRERADSEAQSYDVHTDKVEKENSGKMIRKKSKKKKCKEADAGGENVTAIDRSIKLEELSGKLVDKNGVTKDDLCTDNSGSFTKVMKKKKRKSLNKNKETPKKKRKFGTENSENKVNASTDSVQTELSDKKALKKKKKRKIETECDV